jgi:NAD(P)-dependent dehydrogenase (short-subunit alcohol dehydrogenase family)
MASSRTIVITGASRGLGLATAEKLAGVGHRIIICSRSMVRGRQAVDQIRRALPDAQVDSWIPPRLSRYIALQRSYCKRDVR